MIFYRHHWYRQDYMIMTFRPPPNTQWYLASHIEAFDLMPVSTPPFHLVPFITTPYCILDDGYFTIALLPQTKRACSLLSANVQHKLFPAGQSAVHGYWLAIKIPITEDWFHWYFRDFDILLRAECSIIYLFEVPCYYTIVNIMMMSLIWHDWFLDSTQYLLQCYISLA